jgi:cell wall-associated NlpC family hydrolase
MEAWRVAVVEEAKTWLRTSWHHRARVKGAGVDCGQLIIACFVNAGLVPDFETGEYAQDWMLNNSEERYLGFVEKHLDRVDSPLPGDVAVWKFGHCFSHGGIVVDWPSIIHAYRPERGVVYGEGDKGLLGRQHWPNGGFHAREHRFYSIAGRL